MRLRISSPATSANLGAGFDSLGIALNLCNEFEIADSRISSVHISGYGAENKMLKANNAFVNIFKSTLKSLGKSSERLSFRLHNNIALSRGMGSSSSVIIAAIAGAFAWAQREVDLAEILELSLAYEPHTDNTAPCAYGGFVISTNCHMGARFNVSQNLRAVVAVPHERISTAASRQALKESVSLKDACFNLAASAQIAAAFASGDYSLLRAGWGDRLHQVRRMHALSDVYRRIFAALCASNALSAEQIKQHFSPEFAPKNAKLNDGQGSAYFAALSGSGSSFITLCEASASPKIAAELAQSANLEAVHDLAISNQGIKLEWRNN